MKSSFLNELIYKARYLNVLERCIALLAILLCILYGWLTPRIKIELEMLKHPVLSQQAMLNVAKAPLDDMQIRTVNFYKNLPTHNQVKEILAAFYEEAEIERLEVSTVQFSLDEAIDVSFASYRLSAPLYGDYLGVMRLVKKMLERYPTLALTNIQLTREDKKDNLITADITFVIYLYKDR